MLIRNYGLFWSREKVKWGAPGAGNAGNLSGKRVGAARRPPVDFREQRGIYVLYDEGFRIIYAGQVGGRRDQVLFDRLKQHKNDHLAERWKLFSWFGTRPVVDNGQLGEVGTEPPTPAVALDHIEAVLLASTEPPLNLQRGRWGRSVDQYLQHVEAE